MDMMRQLVILSGKGGTGKTTVATALIRLSGTKAYADCDVDAPNLHLLNHQDTQPETEDFHGLKKAHINQDDCIGCGMCAEHCAFGAIDETDGVYKVNEVACEGCELCQTVCPVGAIDMQDFIAGQTKTYQNDHVFATAELAIGAGNTGLLVTEVKNNMKDSADENTVWAVIDGSPGIGCPVIASMSGVDRALIVTEPTVFAIHDMERIIETAEHFNIAVDICINKADIHPGMTQRIRNYAGDHGLDIIGEIPYDEHIIRAQNEGKSIVDDPSPARDAVIQLYRRLAERMETGLNGDV